MFNKEDLFNVVFDLLVLNKTMSIIQLEISTGVNKIKLNNVIKHFEEIGLVSTEEIKVEYETRTKKAKQGKVSVFEMSNMDKRVTLNSTISKEGYITGLGLGLSPENLKHFVEIKDNIVKELSQDHFFEKLKKEEDDKKKQYLNSVRLKVKKELSKEEWFRLENDIEKSIPHHKKKNICTKDNLIILYSILKDVSFMNNERLESEFNKEVNNIKWGK